MKMPSFGRFRSRRTGATAGAGWSGAARRCRLVLLVALLALLTVPARADHLVGYDWQLTPVAGNRVRVRLTVYTDPVGGGGSTGGDPIVTVAAFARTTLPGATDRLLTTYVLPRTGTRGLPGPGAACSLTSAPVQELTYEAVLTLDAIDYADPAGYYMVWERCCRNQLLTNVPAGQSAPLAATVQFPALPDLALGQLPNTSPRFSEAPPGTALCVGGPARVSFAATDGDGDSLAYALVDALGGFTSPSFPNQTAFPPGPYPPVQYARGFSGAQPLPGRFTLDARTGQLTGVPTQVGTYVVAVAVREYRRGRLIGENRREIELTVAGCPPNGPPRLTQVAPAPPDTVRISGAQNRCFTLRATDPDPGQTLTVQVLGGAPATVAPARFTVPFPAVPTNLTVCWTDCARAGAYLLTLVLRDDGCRPTPPDTLRIPVRVTPAPNRPPFITRAPLQPDTLMVAAGQEISFLATAQDADGDALTLSLHPPPDAPGLAPQTVQGAGTAQLTVRWTPPCAAARATPYALTLRATDGNCRDGADSLRVFILVRGAGALAATDLPNIITPNHDGRNDCFGLGRPAAVPAAGPCADDFREVRIFNRWGKVVFVSIDSAFCWDGAGLSAGTYHYLIRGTQRTLRGLLTVAR